MPRVVRRFALLVACAAALAVTACSNNKGKIEGKWKLNMPGNAAAAMPGDSGMFFEFTADGKFTAYMEILGNRTEIGGAKYSLGSGDWVNFKDVTGKLGSGNKKLGKDKITITGDTMVIDSEKGEKLTLTRYTPGEAAAKK